jgi:hypothetical protein
MVLMSLRLIIEDDEGSTTIVPLGKETITIGRQQGNTIQLTEKNVSRRHARLTPDGEAWVIEDLGSYNGVKVNGRPVDARVVLQEGDVVQIGDYHLALTEDVDRRSLNYDRPRGAAANDGAEPMLASSSTNLPRLSQAELAALSSGQHPQAVPPPQLAAPHMQMVDSGQMPMARVPQAYPAEEPRRRSGMLMGLGLVAIGAIALGGFAIYVSSQGDKKPDASSQVAKNDTKLADSKATEPTKAAPEPVQKSAVAPAEPPGVPVTPTPPDESKQVAPTDPTGTQAVPQPEGDEGDVVVEPPDETPEPVPTKPTQPKKKDATPGKKPNPPSQPKTTPTPPPEPAVDTTQLLADAKASLVKSPATAYDLASKAYRAKASGDAAFIMASAACRMGDEGKAKKAIAKLKGSKRDDAVKLCSIKGITIE